MKHSSSSLSLLLSTLIALSLSQAAFAEQNVALSVDADSLTELKSSWADYFGTHYTGSTDAAGTVWNTVRSFGGPHIGIAPEANPEAPKRKGPFTGKELQFDLSDFHPPRRGNPTAETLIPALIEHKITAIYLTSTIVRPSLEPFDKDRLYWAVRMIHEKHPEAAQHIVWQVGNEVVSGHFDPKDVWGGGKAGQNQKKEDNFFGYDLKWKEDYYIHDYLAPAVEAIQRASRDVYKDPHKIQIALGSMNPYNRQNVLFLANVMAAKFDGRQASTLEGQEVWKHVDFLTVHYMTGSQRSLETLQQYNEDYLKPGKIKGIWLTEDHGAGGRGPVTILDRSMKYLNWVADAGLDSTQTRLCWWGENDNDPGGRGREATTLLGEFLVGSQLHFGATPVEGGTAYVISDATDKKLSRLLVAINPERRGGPIQLGTLQIKLPAAADPSQWSIRATQYSSEVPGVDFDPAVDVSGNTLSITLKREIPEPCLLLLEAKPNN